MNKKPDSEIQKDVRAFALKYGLFGLMTALPMPTTPKFMEYENIYFTDRNAKTGTTSARAGRRLSRMTKILVSKGMVICNG